MEPQCGKQRQERQAQNGKIVALDRARTAAPMVLRADRRRPTRARPRPRAPAPDRARPRRTPAWSASRSPPPTTAPRRPRASATPRVQLMGPTTQSIQLVEPRQPYPGRLMQDLRSSSSSLPPVGEAGRGPSASAARATPPTPDPPRSPPRPHDSPPPTRPSPRPAPGLPRRHRRLSPALRPRARARQFALDSSRIAARPRPAGLFARHSGKQGSA